ncbi:hypothetical protein HDU93_006015 [Gonapodya sp. JEL0774]|nr:hypothetical protein HDU93_006015 [Gonapodya sp. JEL0774]
MAQRCRHLGTTTSSILHPPWTSKPSNTFCPPVDTADEKPADRTRYNNVDVTSIDDFTWALQTEMILSDPMLDSTVLAEVPPFELVVSRPAPTAGFPITERTGGAGGREFLYKLFLPQKDRFRSSDFSSNRNHLSPPHDNTVGSSLLITVHILMFNLFGAYQNMIFSTFPIVYFFYFPIVYDVIMWLQWLGAAEAATNVSTVCYTYSFDGSCTAWTAGAALGFFVWFSFSFTICLRYINYRRAAIAAIAVPVVLAAAVNA